MPPTEAELAAFLADYASDAYAKQAERLLASPHFGERWAVWWLDVARFADTVGYRGDQSQRIFPYRDYVIEVFNKNKPFDQFTIEQLAGDLLPNPSIEQRGEASAFLAKNPDGWNASVMLEGGVKESVVPKKKPATQPKPPEKTD